MLEAGPEIDRAIALALYGEARAPVPPYSTSDARALRLASALEDGLAMTIEERDAIWYCVWWRAPESGRRERIATGSASTKSLAICRSVLNLPPISRAARSERPKSASRFRPLSPDRTNLCLLCSADLAPGANSTICNVCAYDALRVKRKLHEARRATRSRSRSGVDAARGQ